LTDRTEKKEEERKKKGGRRIDSISVSFGNRRCSVKQRRGKKKRKEKRFTAARFVCSFQILAHGEQRGGRGEKEDSYREDMRLIRDTFVCTMKEEKGRKKRRGSRRFLTFNRFRKKKERKRRKKSGRGRAILNGGTSP